MEVQAMRKSNTTNFEKLYDELYKVKETGIVEKSKILESTGWKDVTFNTYFSKKLAGKILERIDNQKYKILNIEKYDKDSFLRFMSQKQEKSEEPFAKNLKEKTNILLEKSRNSAMLAIDIYNRPQTKFKTEGYISMIIIAWTALFHSIFEESGEDYNHYDKEGKPIIIDGETKFIELSECIKRTDEISEAAKKNLLFLIGLRNKIEHRIVPTLDIQVCGECQACLTNFENLLISKYGNYYALSENLAIPLQLTNFAEENLISAKKAFQANHYEDIKNYIYNYRESLSDEVYNSMEYSFKVFLIPKTSNNIKTSDMAIEFLKMTDLTKEDEDKFSSAIAMIKEKQVPVINLNNYKPGKVCEEINKRLGLNIGTNFHAKLWKYYNVRKPGHQADGCNTQYCIYDVANESYLYTEAWIEFLVEKLSDPEEYRKIENYKV